MSKRSELKRHLQTLDDIRSIMNAMKNLSFVEISKVSRFLATQQRVVQKIEEAAGDFMNFFPHRAPAAEHEEREGYLVIGSERGFCGGFNEVIIQRLGECISHSDKTREPMIVLVGRKLAAKMVGDPRVVATVDGPSAAEEIHSVIAELVAALERIQKEKGPFHLCCWTIIYNEDLPSGIQPNLLKPFEKISTGHPERFAFAPQLYLDPEKFLEGILDHYLFAAMYQVFYDSFMAENRQRMRHMESSLQRLDKEWSRLTLKMNSLRQEEITEEIEVIMLSAEILMED